MSVRFRKFPPTPKMINTTQTSYLEYLGLWFKYNLKLFFFFLQVYTHVTQNWVSKNIHKVKLQCSTVTYFISDKFQVGLKIKFPLWCLTKTFYECVSSIFDINSLLSRDTLYPEWLTHTLLRCNYLSYRHATWHMNYSLLNNSLLGWLS